MNKLNLKLSRPLSYDKNSSVASLRPLADLLHNAGRFASESLADFSGIRSHGAYVAGAGEKWIAVEEVLPLFAKRPTQAVTAYRSFVRDGLQLGHRDELYEVVEQTYLGDEQFVETVEERVSDLEPTSAVVLPWSEVKEAVCEYFDLPPSVALQRGRGRKNAKAKRVMAWIAREVGGFTNRETAKLLRQDPAALSRGIIKLADEFSKNSELRRDVEKLCETLRRGHKAKRSIRHA